VKTALIVEDEPSVLMVLVTALRRQGYEVIYAIKPVDAIHLCELGSAPELVITDAVMPGMNARQLLNRLCEILPHLRFLVISGWDRQTLIAHGAILPDDQLLTKPFSPAELRAAIDQLKRSLD